MKHVTSQEIFIIHEVQLKKYKGCAGCADPDKINALIARVFNYIEYEGMNDLYALAAMYFVAIARGHVFVDGNKRTAVAVCLLFLSRNNIHIRNDGTLVSVAVKVAKGSMSVQDLADHLRNLSI